MGKAQSNGQVCNQTWIIRFTVECATYHATTARYVISHASILSLATLTFTKNYSAANAD